MPCLYPTEFGSCAHHLDAMVFSMSEVHQDTPKDDRSQWRRRGYPEQFGPPLALSKQDHINLRNFTLGSPVLKYAIIFKI
jgi:hypothetical protein